MVVKAWLRSVVIAVSLLLIGVQPIFAETTGEIAGYVRDGAGRPVAGASVTIVSPSYSTSTATDSKGFYAFLGIPPDTYSISVRKSGYLSMSLAGFTVVQGDKRQQDFTLTTALKTIAHVTSRSVTSLVQPNQTADEYVVTEQMLENITGTPMTIEQSQVLDALPGFTPATNGPSIRGGAINDLGYEMEGIDIKDPVLGLFMNNGALAGVQQLVVTTGAFDVSTGNTNQGLINEVVKQGTYPGFADVALFKDLGYFYNGFAAEAGGGTPDGRFTWYIATHSLRDENVVGNGDFEPLAVGSTSTVDVNETVMNLFYRWGHDNQNQLQLFAETGFNVYDYNWLVDPTKTPYASNNPLVWASLANGTCNPGGGVATENCGQLTADLLPVFPGQPGFNADTGYPDNENNQHNVMKLEWQHQFSSSSFFSFAMSRTSEHDDYTVPWGGGAFDDYVLDNASTNYGFLATYSNQISTQHNITAGLFSSDEQPGYVAYQNSLAAFTFYDDWCYVKGIATTPQFGCSGANGTPLSTFPDVEYQRNDMIHRNYAYIRDEWQPSDRWFINWGFRWDNQKMNIPSDAAEQGSLLNYNSGTGQYIQTLGPAINSSVTDPTDISPRMFATYTMDRNDVLRFGWGKYVDFPTELQVETKLILDPALAACNIVNGCFAPLPGYGVTNHVTNLYQQSLYNFNTYFNSQYMPTQPQYVSDWEFSWEHDYGGGWQTKVTPYFRKGTNYVVGSQAIIATLADGAPLYGPYTYSNLGMIQSTGAELSIQKTQQYGLSGWLNLTYDNTLANYDSDYFPTVSYAAIALGHLYHVEYAAPISATFGLDENTPSGFHAYLELPYESGYWYGVGKETFIYENFYTNGQQAPTGGPGTVIKPVEVPNTNLINGYYGYYYVNPNDPGTYEHPNIIGSKGTPDGNDPGSIEAPGIAFVNLTFAQDLGPNKEYQIGIRIANLFGNFSPYTPTLNRWYTNNGYGISGPGSGVNLNSQYGEPYQYNLGPQPYVSEPIGPERQFLVFFASKV